MLNLRNYVDYNTLKKSIKDLRDQQKKETKNSNVDEIIDLLRKESGKEITSSSKSEPFLENLLNNNLGKYVSEFLMSIDQEINKFFTFFTILEKDTYNEIKRLLYLEGNYS